MCALTACVMHWIVVMKRPLTRLFVALVNLVAAILEFAVRLVQFAIVLVGRATRQLEVGKARQVVVEAPVQVTAPSPIPAPPVDDEKLIGALTGLGFRAGPVRAFAATVRARIGVEPIDGLVREGIMQLSETRQEKRS